MSERTWRKPEERLKEEKLLLANIGLKRSELEKLWREVNETWVYEDAIYRFYHQSFKVYHLQSSTLTVVHQLQALLPHLPLNDWFMEIVKGGTGKEFKIEDNDHWLASTQPILEAFFHARYFLEMVLKYGNELQEPPTMVPSGWAAVLYLFNIR